MLDSCGLREQPFTLPPHPRFMYLSQPYQETAAAYCRKAKLLYLQRVRGTCGIAPHARTCMASSGRARPRCCASSPRKWTATRRPTPSRESGYSTGALPRLPIPRPTPRPCPRTTCEPLLTRPAWAMDAPFWRWPTQTYSIAAATLRIPSATASASSRVKNWSIKTMIARPR